MAVDNFIAFKKLMVKRNTELNQQALVMDKVQENVKSTTASTTPESSAT